MFKLKNKLGLGLAALGRPGYINLGHNQNIGPDKSKQALYLQAEKVLSFAYQSGIQYFDVARVYGASEEFLSTWIRKQNQFNGFVGSKWGYEYLADWKIDTDVHERKDHSLSFLKKQWVETRLNLGKNIDLYQIHSVTSESNVLNDRDVLNELHNIKNSGIQIGISTSGPDQEETIKKLLEINRVEKIFSFIQCTINILEQSCQQTLIKASESGINIIAKEVFANGRLSAANKNFHQKEISNLVNIAIDLNLSLEELSLIWAYQQNYIKIVLTGAATVEQIQSNFDAIGKSDLTLPNLSDLSISKENYWQSRKSLKWN
ncbi:MAG: aldo/keto reductase [Gammaproteobacteria bacterium]